MAFSVHPEVDNFLAGVDADAGSDHAHHEGGHDAAELFAQPPTGGGEDE